MSANYVVHYEIVDEAGTVVNYGSCWSGEVNDVAVGEGLSLRVQHDTKPVVHDQVQYGYGAVRSQEYPTVEEQIGVLWKVIANLPAKYLTEEATAMMQKIADVKAQYEKGAQYVVNDGSDPMVRSRFMKAKE